MNPTPYLDQLAAQGDPGRVEQMRTYHKMDRVYLGVQNPQINDLTQQWRTDLTLADRIGLADALWQTDIFRSAPGRRETADPGPAAPR